MKGRAFTTLLLLICWFTAVNHCAFESFFSANQTTESGDCASHSSKDPSSHKEGQPCGGSAVAESGTQNQALKASIAVAPIDLWISLVTLFEPTKQMVRASSSDFFEDRLPHWSLGSIAIHAPPNAPPYTLA